MVKRWSKGGQKLDKLGDFLGFWGEKRIIALPLDKKEYLCSMFL